MPDMTEVKDLLEQQHKAFEEFKQVNDRILEAKAEGKAVSEMEAKLAKTDAEIVRLSKEMDDLVKKGRLDATSNASEKVAEEHKAAWLQWVRKGAEDGLEDLEKKAMSVGSPADGGYALPIEQDKQILRLLEERSPMRQVCRVVRASTEDYRKLVDLGGVTAGWVGETDARPETDTAKYAEIKPVMGEVYANPAVTQKALDDLFFDVAGELVRDIAEVFAEKEGAAFLNGDGTNKPKGLLAYNQAETADSARPFGTLQFLKTGVAGGFKAASATVSPADDLVDLIYTLKKGYRAGAKFMLNNKTLSVVRKWKTPEGEYLWQPSMQAGQPSSIFGYGIVENEDMPDAGAGSIPIMFGDFARTFWIFDRAGTRSLRDPYTHKPYIHFYTTKRVGSMLVDSNATKLLKLAA